MNAIDALRWLESVGYRFTVGEQGALTFAHHGAQDPGEELPRRYLEVIKRNRNDVMSYLRERTAKHEAWLEAYEAWDVDTNVTNDSIHMDRIARAAIDAGLPFYEDGQENIGADVWLNWAQKGTGQ